VLEIKKFAAASWLLQHSKQAKKNSFTTVSPTAYVAAD
jgi:hypothetical protein